MKHLSKHMEFEVQTELPFLSNYPISKIQIEKKLEFLQHLNSATDRHLHCEANNNDEWNGKNGYFI